MIAHYHGQIWNGSEFAKSIGATQPTTRRYMDLLTDAQVVRQLQPWHENIKKRQVKSPKIYVRDTGILHSLLSLPDETISTHPKLRASWEGFVIEQILDITNSREACFWASHEGAELDLLLFRNGRRIGFEVKYADAPKRTRSMMSAMMDLHLSHLYVVYPGSRSYPIDSEMTVTGINNLPELLHKL